MTNPEGGPPKDKRYITFDLEELKQPEVFARLIKDCTNIWYGAYGLVEGAELAQPAEAHAIIEQDLRPHMPFRQLHEYIEQKYAPDIAAFALDRLQHHCPTELAEHDSIVAEMNAAMQSAQPDIQKLKAGIERVIKLLHEMYNKFLSLDSLDA